VKIELDPVKSERNTKLRSLPFDRAVDFDWEDADGIRVISFRKANRREALRHEKPLTIDE